MRRGDRSKSTRVVRNGLPLLIVACCVILVVVTASWQAKYVYSSSSSSSSSFSWTSSLLSDHARNEQSTSAAAATFSTGAVARTLAQQQSPWSSISNPLGIPKGQAPNLPSIRVNKEDSDENVDKKRQFYGGKGDKLHLGGFTELDLHGVSPTTWQNMVTNLNVHSLLDVGCGRGISTSWFADHGVEILCVEGSHDAFHQSVLDAPETVMIEHDFSRGPWWPAKTFDAVWSVEFLEHVGLNYHFNYITTFRKAALLFVTSSRWGGWHHVEVHMDEWWILKYESYGFYFSEKLTNMVRGWAHTETRTGNMAPTGERYNAQHIWLSMKVFINPVVASLPEHSHLFLQGECFAPPCEGNNGSAKLSRAEAAQKKPPIQLTPVMDRKWEERIKRNVKQKNIPANKPKQAEMK